MSQPEDGEERPKTIVEELDEAGEELEELSKFFAKKKGRESYDKSVKRVASLLKPKARCNMRTLQKIDKVPDPESDYDTEENYYHDSFMDKDTFELVNMISMLNKEPNLLPSIAGLRNAPQSTQTSNDDCCCCGSKDPDFDTKYPKDPCKFCNRDEDSGEHLSMDNDNSDVLVNSSNDQYNNHSSKYCGENLHSTDSLLRMSRADVDYLTTASRQANEQFSRMSKVKSIPGKGRAKQYGYRGGANGDSQFSPYRSMDMNSYSGRDRIFKSPNKNIGPTSGGTPIMEKLGYQNATSAQQLPSRRNTLSRGSPSHLTSILTGNDGKLMTGPNAVARLREHQQTSSKLFRPVRNDPLQRLQQRTQLMIQNLKPSSTSVGNSSIQQIYNGFESLDSPPNLLLSPKPSSVQNKNLSSRNGPVSHPEPSLPLETFTVGVVKRPQVAQQFKMLKSTGVKQSGTPKSGNNTGSLSIRQCTTKSMANSDSGNFGVGKVSSEPTIERRHSIGSTSRSGPGSAKKRDGKKFKSPRVKKSNESNKTEPEAINVFDNEKLNSILMQMMSETDSTGQYGTDRIMTK